MVSIVIHRAKNVERAVEAAKRRYEHRCHVTDWWLHADGFEMEKSTYSIGRTDSHQRQSPTHRRPRRLYADRPSCNAALMRHCHCGSLHSGLAGSQLIAIAGGQTLQGVSHRADHTVPVARAGLAKLAQRRIPGAVVAVQQPAPAGIEAVQQPDRLAERAGQMGDRGIDADHQIEASISAAVSAKSSQFGGEIVQRHAGRRIGRPEPPVGLFAMR